MNIMLCKLQQTINKLESWPNNNGFKFSIDKTFTFVKPTCTHVKWTLLFTSY